MYTLYLSLVSFTSFYYKIYCAGAYSSRKSFFQLNISWVFLAIIHPQTSSARKLFYCTTRIPNPGSLLVIVGLYCKLTLGSRFLGLFCVFRPIRLCGWQKFFQGLVHSFPYFITSPRSSSSAMVIIHISSLLIINISIYIGICKKLCETLHIFLKPDFRKKGISILFQYNLKNWPIPCAITVFIGFLVNQDGHSIHTIE